ncbi:MAG: hypothetical protein AAGC54_17930 [Cyanobacteria bacterium P01_F01_bin.4]
MLFKVPEVISAEQQAEIVAQLKSATFIDGKATAGWYAKQVKHNQQLKSDDAEAPREKIIAL